MKGYFLGGFIGNCANAFVLAKEHGLFDNFMKGAFTVVLIVSMGICGGLAVLAGSDGNSTLGWAGGGGGGTTVTASNLGIFSFLYNGTGEYYDNGSAESNGTVSGSAIGNSAYTSTLYIYSRASNTLGITGYLSEFILWDSDQDANRAAIESAINSYYSAY